MGEDESSNSSSTNDSISKDDPDVVANNDEKISHNTAELRDASKQYGLPPGWTVKAIGKARTRKRWYCPEKKGYDSLKKAFASLAAKSNTPSSAEGTTNIHYKEEEEEEEEEIEEENLRKLPSNKHKKRKKQPNNNPKKKNKVARHNGANHGKKKSLVVPIEKYQKQQKYQDQEEEEQGQEYRDNFDIPQSDPEPYPETALEEYLLHSTSTSPSSSSLALILNWNPSSWYAKVIGCRIRVHESSTDTWAEGRIVMWDPITQKHKVQYNHNKSHHQRTTTNHHQWIYLADSKVTTVQIATRIVWAHVKGFPWWPAQVMEAMGNNLPTSIKPANSTMVVVEFFGSTHQISKVRDTEEYIRPFQGGSVDPSTNTTVVGWNAAAAAVVTTTTTTTSKKKKQEKKDAIQHAVREESIYQQYQHQASQHFATLAFQTIQQRLGANHLLGKRVQFHRADLNYPYGETVRGFVRQYSPTLKKWLVDYVLQFPHQETSQMSTTTNTNNFTTNTTNVSSTIYTPSFSYSRGGGGGGATPYPPSWVNLLQKDCNLIILSDDLNKQKKNKQIQPPLTLEDVASFVMPNYCPTIPQRQKQVQSRCILCLRNIKKSLSPDCKVEEHDIIIQCHSCHHIYHNTCLDQPLPLRLARQLHERQANNSEALESPQNQQIIWTCDKCCPCEGCHKTDLLFGCKTYSKSVGIVSLVPEDGNKDQPKNTIMEAYQPRLCSMCVVRYDEGNFCPNCGITFDDDTHTLAQMAKLWRRRHLLQNKSLSEIESDDEGDFENTKFPFTDNASNSVEKLAQDQKKKWGFGPSTMLTCDSCNKWVHAGCALLSKSDYEAVTNKEHPIYGIGEFLCAPCCRKKCQSFLQKMDEEDKMSLFAMPVTEEVAPNYKDVITNPMDLHTLSMKFRNNEFSLANYVWVKEMFELMVYNAMVYNAPNSKYWNEARRYHTCCMSKIFNRADAPAAASYRTKYAAGIIERIKIAEETLRHEKEREKKDEKAQKKDLVAGAEVASSMDAAVEAPLSKPLDVPSCVPPMEIRMSLTDAHYTCWMDSCFSCGSTGAPDTMLFCVDCGEAFHSFCCGAPVLSMDEIAVIGWRCPNCKLCEISGLCPQDENQIVYCDLCDRAFDVKLVFPPIETVPQGLFICDQCVVCTSCDQKTGKRRRCWSQSPTLCHRCGGNSFAKVKKVKTAEKKGLVEKSTFLEHRIVPNTDDIARELQIRYEDELRWHAREIFRDEYQSICDDAQKLFEKGKAHDHYRQILSEERCSNLGVPKWKRSRAARCFLIFSNKYRRSSPKNTNIISAVLKAKLAASFLDIGCDYFGVEYTNLVKHHQRASSLLVPPNEAGEVDLPDDSLTLEQIGDKIMSVSKWCISSGAEDSQLKAMEADLVEGSASTNVMSSEFPSSSEVKYLRPRDPPTVFMPRPIALKGWDECKTTRRWTDPRTCCLCHTCGDDEAGLPIHSSGSDTSSLSDEGKLGRTGRLLPIGDGTWIHVSCALWSSEVFESENGVIHRVDKARQRGNKMKCFGCGRKGPTLGCSKSNCPVNFHFSCAVFCGAVMTSKQLMYCKAHREHASQLIPPEEASHEQMKSLRVDLKGYILDSSKPCLRIGSLVVHSLGVVEQHLAGFHSEHYITPPGYTATRIFWSFKKRLTRTLYLMKVERSSMGYPIFSIRDAEDPGAEIRGKSVEETYSLLMRLVEKINFSLFALQNDSKSINPILRIYKDTFGLNGPQFFGFGINAVRKALENAPGAVAAAIPLPGNSVTYKFCFSRPKKDDIADLLRQRAAEASEKALENVSGCARTEGIIAVAKSGGSGRITRALVRSADEELFDLVSGVDRSSSGKGDEQLVGETKNAEKIQAMYQEMKSVPMECRLTAKRSHIHGWGLFTKNDLPKHSMIIEYMGETVRQAVADKRERAYEMAGLGSCYMFRLDAHRIVDATMIGCMARFMNHCCQPNAYAKIITVETEKVLEKKIVVCALRDILAGEEITYDYKFPVEDGSLKCTCGAPNCIGRMN